MKHDKLEAFLGNLRPIAPRPDLSARVKQMMKSELGRKGESPSDHVRAALAESKPHGPPLGLREKILGSMSAELACTRKPVIDRLAASPRVWLGIAASFLLVLGLGAVLETSAQSRLAGLLHTQGRSAVERRPFSEQETREMLSKFKEESPLVQARLRRRLLRSRRLDWVSLRSGFGGQARSAHHGG